jgi:uncharacterized membrane protein YkvA (DUF1232 family)
MERKRGFLLAAVSVLIAGGVLLTTNPVLTVVASSAEAGVAMPDALMTVAVDDQPIERQIGGLTRSVFREIRRSFRTVGWMFWSAVDWWGSFFKSAAFSLGVAIVAALADGGLVTAWRAEGLRALMTSSTLMLYVYARLLFSGGVNLAPKLLLLGALIYGVVRRDLVPDRSLVPGRVEDVVLIVIATRAFVYACPEALVNEYADRAINLKRRVLSPQRARSR